MCRIAIFLGSSEKFRELYEPLIKSFKEVSEYDWIFEKYTKGEEKSHSDGWGFLGMTLGDEGVMHFRSMTPFYKDRLDVLNAWVESIEGDIIFLLHVRAGSPNMAKNIFSVHPIYVEAPSGSQIYLIHNGTLFKEPLARLAGDTADNPRYTIYNDTYYAGKIIANMNVFSMSKLQSLLEIFSHPKYLYSAFNFGLVWLSSKTSYLVAGPIYRTAKGRELVEYYRLYKVEEEDYDLYISSTNKEWIEENGYEWGFEEVANGFITVYPDFKLDDAVGFQLPRIL